MHLFECLESLRTQTRKADEVVIVQDGPIPIDLTSVIQRYITYLPIILIRLQNNQGQGVAANIGLLFCKHSIIARMDSDDICIPERFSKQIDFMEAHPDIDVLGANIMEFNERPEDGNSTRVLPTHHEDIVRYAKSRSPINNMTAVYRRDSAIKAGSYLPWRGFEDYYLWVRMIMAGSKFYNLDEILVYARSGNGMQLRRGGLEYVRLEIGFLVKVFQLGFFNKYELCRNILYRCPIRLLPASFRSFFYRRYLRQ